MEKNHKIFILNVVILFILFITFLITHSYIQKINSELLCRTGEHDIKFFENGSVKYIQESQNVQIGLDLIIPSGIALILIIENIFQCKEYSMIHFYDRIRKIFK